MGDSGFWPHSIIDSVQKGNLVLVVGAGVSASSSNSAGEFPPTWKDLIKKLSIHATGNGGIGKDFDRLVESNALLDAAEFLMVVAARNGRVNDVKAAINRITDRPDKGDHFRGSKWHSALFATTPSVIITTNYDKIIERASQSGYAVHNYSSQTIGQDLRRGEPILIKVHGSVDDTENIILTQTDYSRLYREGRHALDVIRALFLTRVMLFVGYSVGDPDIRILLQNTVGGLGQTSSHYMLTPKLEHFQKMMMEKAFGVTPLEYDPKDGHREALEYLEEFENLPR